MKQLIEKEKQFEDTIKKMWSVALSSQWQELKAEYHKIINPTRDIESIVCSAFKITQKDLHSKLRNRPFVLARQVIMWYELVYLGKTLSDVSLRFRLDHSTAIHARKTIYNLIDTDSSFENKLNGIILKIRGQ